MARLWADAMSELILLWILAAIIGSATMAKIKNQAQEGLQRDLENILNAGNRAADLVRQILAFSRKESSDNELFQPHLLLKEVVKMLRSTIPSSIEICDRIDPRCGWILANQTRLHQVIMNLCTNAIHAMEKEKGRLDIELSPVLVGPEDIREQEGDPGPFIRLRIKDSGCGMNQQTLERIFDPYFTTKPADKGTGLGLAVVHGIVLEMQGFIRIDSTVGEGSCFDVYLPEFIYEKQSTGESPEQPELPRGNERLLVVDDDRSVAEITGDLLTELGYRVDTRYDSEEALEHLRQHPGDYALLLTDQTMPKLTGQELAEQLLMINPQLPVILCTGYSSLLRPEEQLPENVVQILSKPIRLPALADILRQTLDNQGQPSDLTTRSSAESRQQSP